MTKLTLNGKEIMISKEDTKKSSTSVFNKSRVTISMLAQKYMELSDQQNIMIIPIKEHNIFIIKIITEDNLSNMI